MGKTNLSVFLVAKLYNFTYLQDTSEEDKEEKKENIGVQHRSQDTKGPVFNPKQHKK